MPHLLLKRLPERSLNSTRFSRSMLPAVVVCDDCRRLGYGAQANRQRAVDPGCARHADAGIDAALKRQVPTAGDSAHQYPAYFGLLIVSCERGNIRQTPEGLMVYGDDARWSVPVQSGVDGLNNFLEMYRP